MGSYPPTPPPAVQGDDSEVVGSRPEYLPPAAQYAPPPRRRSWWTSSWATYVLVGLNCGVFLVMWAKGVNPLTPSSRALLAFGADNAGDVLLGGQWLRIVTAMFVHVGIIHLLTNMWCLWNLGLLAEPLMGSAGVLAVYVLTGSAGNLLSTLYSWWSLNAEWSRFHDPGIFPTGAGASGAVFGIAGALIILLKSKRLPVPQDELKKLRRSVIYFAAINLVIGLGITGGTELFGRGVLIDNSAHVGGFLCGLVFAAPMVPRLGSPRGLFRSRLRTTVVLTSGLLVLFGFFLANFAG